VFLIVAKTRSTITQETLSVELPTVLLDTVRALLLNPRTGRVRYGAMRKTIMSGLCLWLATQKDKHT
jgi:hypothetical protein